MKKDEESTSKRLEVLLKLWNAKKPISYVDLPQNSFNAVSNAVKSNLVKKFKESDERYPHQKVSFYQLTPEGEKYLNKVLQYASRCFEKIMNSN